ncbi:MAG: hypothetical protein IBX56_11780 [Methylomicrobium sp.]|nr:hypothetical protein [Methylomicrobium sp.]
MITYKLNDNCPVDMVGKVLTGGVPTMYKGERMVKFAEKHKGKVIYLRINDKPDLAELVARYDQEIAEQRAKAKATLEAAVPGLSELREALNEAESENERYHEELQTMMEDGQNDGAVPPKPFDKSLDVKYDKLREKYPRAALWVTVRIRAKMGNSA